MAIPPSFFIAHLIWLLIFFRAKLQCWNSPVDATVGLSLMDAVDGLFLFHILRKRRGQLRWSETKCSCSSQACGCFNITTNTLSNCNLMGVMEMHQLWMPSNGQAGLLEEKKKFCIHVLSFAVYFLLSGQRSAMDQALWHISLLLIISCENGWNRGFGTCLPAYLFTYRQSKRIIHMYKMSTGCLSTCFIFRFCGLCTSSISIVSTRSSTPCGKLDSRQHSSRCYLWNSSDPHKYLKRDWKRK